jgi:hypothetical protein
MKHVEDDLQKVCVRWFRAQYPEPHYLIHHSPNGGKRNAREAGRLKAQGVRAGFPDLIILSKFKMLFIEMKSEKGMMSENQKQVREMILNYDMPYHVVKNIDEFIKVCNHYLK